MQGCELLSVAEMGEADRLAIAGGVTGLAADGAGRACGGRRGDGLAGSPAARLRRLWAWQQRRRRLRGRQAPARAGLSRCAWACSATPRALRGDAAAMAKRWGEAPETSLHVDLRSLGGAGDLIIDALFGAGLSRPLQGAAAEVVAAINACGKTVLAVDVPSGLDGSTGSAAGRGGAGDAHGHLFPPQARPPAAAGTRAVRRGDGSPTSAFPTAVLAEIAPRTFAQPAGALARGTFPGRGSTATSTRAATPWSYPARRKHRGCPARCARRLCAIGAGLVTLVGSGGGNGHQCDAADRDHGARRWRPTPRSRSS